MSANDRLLRAFEAHYRTLLTFVRRRTAATSHADAAADIVQDAFLRIATLAAPQQVQQPQAFFRRVVENLMIDRFRERILLPLPLAHEDADDGDCRENVSAKAHRADAPDDLLQANVMAMTTLLRQAPDDYALDGPHVYPNGNHVSYLPAALSDAVRDATTANTSSPHTASMRQ